ncbi:MAG: topoisomerase DNA-binding C4 zinc finger domain-containing protein [Candidatus Micrarchaeota archaeon]
MEKIQEGKLDKDTVINEGKEILVQILDKWKKSEKKIGEELAMAFKETQKKENQVGKCDKCGNELKIIRMKDGRQFIGCGGYPNCRNAYPLPGGTLVKTLDDVCKECGKPRVRIIKGKRKYDMCVDPKCPTKEKWAKKTAEKTE